MLKRFIIVICVLVCVGVLSFYAVMVRGLYIDLREEVAVEPVFRVLGRDILRKDESGSWRAFEIRGVDLSTNMPGGAVLDFAPDVEDYTRWLEAIAALGANTVRVYTIADDDFYQALYQFNTSHDAPLYLLQGLQVSDRANYGFRDIYDDGFLGLLLENGVTAVDVIHGNRAILLGNTGGTGNYRWDLSPWVVGYLVGHEWDSGNIAYLNESTLYPTSYQGAYFSTGPQATRFEAVLARIMDRIVSYETAKYKQQRLIGFVNSPSNDPFEFTDLYSARFLKYSRLDAEHVLPSDALLSGYYTAYRLNSFSRDYLQYLTPRQADALGDILINLDTSDLYRGYLDLLGKYHTMPVIAAGYGFSTSRVPIWEDEYPLTERQQGQALVEVWQEAREAGWAGGFVSTWQDVWDRRTWNTSYATFEFKDPLWQDVQTEGQCYGLMAFSLEAATEGCVVDGDASEWTEEDVVWRGAAGRLSMRYDEKYLYFYAQSAASEPGVFYIPIDTTPKSGSNYCREYDLAFERPCDFVIVIDGRDNSRVLVQERYEILWVMHAYDLAREDPYYEIRAVDSPVFRPISVMVEHASPVPVDQWLPAATYETGKLRHGNADPDSSLYDSLADFCFTENGVEIRIPWQLLNFASPAEMMIHDDYYEHYGVEYLPIDEMYVGLSAGASDTRIPMAAFPLEGWEKPEVYRERLKESYFILQKCWTALER